MNRHSLLVILFFLCSSVAQASNWQWLKNSALESLTDADWEVLSDTLDTALNTAPDGEVRHWKNPESGNGGSIRLLDSTSMKDSNCRRVQIITETTSKREGDPLTFCKNPEGQWLITPSSTLQKQTK